jgi:hypothetical protein
MVSAHQCATEVCSTSAHMLERLPAAESRLLLDVQTLQYPGSHLESLHFVLHLDPMDEILVVFLHAAI